jgi:hypothetical protein
MNSWSRIGRLIVLAVALASCGCASSGSKVADPAIARFVGTWQTPPGRAAATLRVQQDDSARLTIGADGERPLEIVGHCNPGSDTVTFVEDDGPRSEHRVILLATRPDGSLAGSLNGVPLKFLRR